MRQVAISMHGEAFEQIHHFVEGANEAQGQFKFRHILLTNQERKLLDRAKISAPKACEQAFSLKTRHGLETDDVFVAVLDGNLQDEEDDEYFVVDSSDYPTIAARCPSISIISLYYRRAASAFMKHVEREWEGMLEVEKRRRLSDSITLLLLGSAASQLTNLDYHAESVGCVMDYCQTPADLLEALVGDFRFCARCLDILGQRDGGEAVVRISSRLTERRYMPLKDRTVFLSYAWADWGSVRAVGQWLRNRGVVTRLDRYDFVYGNRVLAEIKRNMEACSAIVIFYSKNSKDRKYTNLERDLAGDLRTEGRARVIYFCLDDSTPPDVQEASHLAIKAKGKSFEAACQELLRGVFALRGVPQDVDLSAYKDRAPWD